MGEGVGRWPMEVVFCFWNPNTGLVTRVGGWGGGVGRWPMEGREGAEMGGGHQRAVWEQ